MLGTDMKDKKAFKVSYEINGMAKKEINWVKTLRNIKT
jgi:hypothetical protein